MISLAALASAPRMVEIESAERNGPRAIMESVEAGILGEYLNRKAWDEAEAELTIRLSAAEEPERIAFLHLFLATLHKLRARHAMRRGDTEQARHFRREALASFRSAAETAPRDVAIRVSFAEFLIKHYDRHVQALAMLEPFGADDFSSKDDATYQDHKRLAWRGTALVLLGEIEPGADALEAAYAESFSNVLPGSFNTGLWLLTKRGARLPADRVDRIAAGLRNFKMHRTTNVDRIAASLRAEP